MDPVSWGLLGKLKKELGAEGDAASTSGSVHAKLEELLGRATETRLARLDAAMSTRAAPGDILVDPATDVLDGSLLDAAVTTRATPAQVDTQVNNRLNTASPSSPNAGSVYAELDALLGYVDEVESLLKNGTYGLSALDSDLGTLLNRVAANVDVDVSTRAAPNDVWPGTVHAGTHGSVSDSAYDVLFNITGRGALKHLSWTQSWAGAGDFRLTIDGTAYYFHVNDPGSSSADRCLVGGPYDTVENNVEPHVVVAGRASSVLDIQFQSSLKLEAKGESQSHAWFAQTV